MAKEIVVWCEVHLTRDDERVPGREYEIAVDGTLRVVDLCADCHQVHVGPVEAFLAEFGEPVAKTRGSYKKAKKKVTVGPAAEKVKARPDENGEYVCDAPGCGRSFSRPQGLGRHRLSHKF